jgi:hypothetical protein
MICEKMEDISRAESGYSGDPSALYIEAFDIPSFTLLIAEHNLHAVAHTEHEDSRLPRSSERSVRSRVVAVAPGATRA